MIYVMPCVATLGTVMSGLALQFILFTDPWVVGRLLRWITLACAASAFGIQLAIALVWWNTLLCCL